MHALLKQGLAGFLPKPYRRAQLEEERDFLMKSLDDLELMLAEDEFDMLEELEFYAWLEEQPELGPAIVTELQTYLRFDAGHPAEDEPLGTLGDYTLRRLSDGTEVAETPYRKV